MTPNPTHSLLVRWFIIMGVSLSEQCIADSLNVMAHKSWITAEFVTVCCSISVVKQYFVQPFLRLMKLTYWGYTHAFTNLHNEVIRWISHAYQCRLCMDLPEANSITWCMSSSFLGLPSRRRCALAVALLPSLTRQRAGHTSTACTKLPGLHEIFKYAHLKFTIYGRKHTSFQWSRFSNQRVLHWMLPTNMVPLEGERGTSRAHLC